VYCKRKIGGEAGKKKKYFQEPVKKRNLEQYILLGFENKP
jgi:hypothetical protein